MKPAFPSPYVAAALGALALAAAVTATSQEGREAGSRQLWDEEFVKARPAAPAPAAKAGAPRKTTAAASAGPSFVGVTLWRLEPAAEGTRALTVEGEGRRWAPMRAEVGTAIPEGQHVRVAVEASRPGFLYVVDRERYADGTTGDPVLVFPTRRIRGGENAVRPGKVVEIPDHGDQPPYFTLRRSRAGHEEEELLLLVAPEPLAEVTVGQDAQPLARAQVEEWERRWGGAHARLESPGGPGRAYTAAEQEAARSQTRLLTRGEPLPQTLYRVQGRAGSPALVAVRLRIAPPR
ncbi:MAG TPA: hypothetical protein VFO85_18490 [Vicinamibacteria bacterium]|nr:hypothetical protein [Vicinamibacteria bacterium]